MRIIGGQWKRTRLAVPDRPGLRPTPDRVRETIFNWLGQDLGGWRVLDAFAGTGALGFEAASRGAAAVCVLERDAGLVQNLLALRTRLQATTVDVHAADALRWMTQRAATEPPFDLVFLDPPYALDLFMTALAACAGLLAPDGRVYLEADRAFEAPDLRALGWCLLRYQRAGAVHAHLLARDRSDTAAAAQSLTL